MCGGCQRPEAGASAEVGSRNDRPRSCLGIGDAKDDVEETIVDLTATLGEWMRRPRQRAGPRRPALRGVQEGTLVPGPVGASAGDAEHRVMDFDRAAAAVAATQKKVADLV
jgi:hypothetical protein